MSSGTHASLTAMQTARFRISHAREDRVPLRNTLRREDVWLALIAAAFSVAAGWLLATLGTG